MIALPLLTIGIDYSAIGSAFLAEWIGGSMTWSLFSRECVRVLGLGQVAAAILKTAALAKAEWSRWLLLWPEAGGATEGVGRAATRGVVVSVFLVLILDVFLVRLSQIWFKRLWSDHHFRHYQYFLPTARLQIFHWKAGGIIP